MGYSIDIDTGGTFTDGFVVTDGEVRTVKVPTTPHDLTLCFLECVKAAAAAFDRPLQDFLAHTDIIRFSNTIGTNTIIQRDGAKLGLLISRELESLLSETDARAQLVDPDLTLAVDEAVDDAGAVVRPPDRGQLLDSVQILIDRGARVLVVVFANSDLNAQNERLARQIIKQEYPHDYLGFVPVFLSSDISPRAGHLERLNSAVLNAYIHPKLTRLLYNAGEELREQGYQHSLLIGHNNGAAARVAKTRAINTYNSGPAAGLLGTRELGWQYGRKALISADMGGTSFDLGYVAGDQPSYALNPTIEGFRCNLPMMAVRTLGAGGGSIVAVDDDGLRVGPQSAGALPGPACFDLGGEQATVTDADLVAGLIDPDYFLDGRIALNSDRATAAIERSAAAPLGISVEEAARRIKACVDREMGLAAADLVRRLNSDEPPTMVAYGGACGLHACGIAAAAGISRVLITPFAPVYSAFSSSLMDVGHIYYRRIARNFGQAELADAILRAANEMWQEALRDMRGEGFTERELASQLQLIIADTAGERELLLPADHEAMSDTERILALGREACRRLDCSECRLNTLALIVRAKIRHYRLPEVKSNGAPVERAIKGHRSVLANGGEQEVPVLDRQRLGPGHVLEGPALLESPQTNVFLPGGWRLNVDGFNNLELLGSEDD